MTTRTGCSCLVQRARLRETLELPGHLELLPNSFPFSCHLPKQQRQGKTWRGGKEGKHDGESSGDVDSVYSPAWRDP